MKPAVIVDLGRAGDTVPVTSDGAATETGRSAIGRRTLVGPSSTRKPERELAQRRRGPGEVDGQVLDVTAALRMTSLLGGDRGEAGHVTETFQVPGMVAGTAG